MLFWTPDIPCELKNWLNTATDRTLCCEVNPWNCAGSSEFEARIAETAKCLCIPITIRGDQVEGIIHTIWQYISSNKSRTESFITKNHTLRRDELRQQIRSQEIPDLSIYDCVDLLSEFNTATVLCIRIDDSIPDYLMGWVDYMSRYTCIKVIILYPKTLRKRKQFIHLRSLIAPVLKNSCIVDACNNAVYQLTGNHMQQNEMITALSISHSLNDFLSIVQTTILSQCTMKALLSPTGKLILASYRQHS